MISHIKYTAVQRQFANMAREKAGNLDVLYHGTRHAQSIMKTGALFHSMPGERKVCLTRSAEVAAYWASIKRDCDEGRGSILIFDRQSLERRYKVVPNPEVYWHSKTLFHDEAEEEIWETVTDVHDHLIGFVSGPTARRSRGDIERARKWRNEMEVKCRLLSLCNDAGSSQRAGSSPSITATPLGHCPRFTTKCSDASAKTS
jgi:hypothetical protein